jgi:voltage-gated potassium channel
VHVLSAAVTPEVTETNAEAAHAGHLSTSYELSILVLTVFSLILMALSLLPFDEAVQQLLLVYQNSLCVIFLIDFAANLRRAPTWRAYVIHQRGWLDLIGSLPALGVFNISVLLRLARLSRLTRILRLMHRENQKQLVDEVLHNRGQYAALVTLLLGFIVLTSASVLVLVFEAAAPDANITTGGDAVWWAIVTITTVGYGDKYPITAAGRVVGVFVMFAGVGIIGSLAGILSSVLLPPPRPPERESNDRELAELRSELAALRRLLEGQNRPTQ